jgi:hypothetical protein
MMWALAVAVAAVGSLLLMQTGLLDATHALAMEQSLCGCLMVMRHLVWD